VRRRAVRAAHRVYRLRAMMPMGRCSAKIFALCRRSAGLGRRCPCRDALHPGDHRPARPTRDPAARLRRTAPNCWIPRSRWRRRRVVLTFHVTGHGAASFAP
jgi:hypothetical protein